MDKKEKLLTISVKKAWIGGTIFTLIVSALYALLISTFIRYLLINIGEKNDILCVCEVPNITINSTIKFFVILWPIMITIVGITLVSFLVIFNKKDK